MGWSSGRALATKMIDLIDYLSDNEYEKVQVFHDMINAFEDFDCDNLHECIGDSEAFDKAFQEMYPEHWKEIMENS